MAKGSGSAAFCKSRLLTWLFFRSPLVLWSPHCWAPGWSQHSSYCRFVPFLHNLWPLHVHLLTVAPDLGWVHFSGVVKPKVNSQASVTETLISPTHHHVFCTWHVSYREAILWRFKELHWLFSSCLSIKRSIFDTIQSSCTGLWEKEKKPTHFWSLKKLP